MPTYNIQQNPYYQIPVARNWIFDRLVSAAQAPGAPAEGPYGKKVGMLRSFLGDETNRMNMADRLRQRDVELGRKPFEVEAGFEREQQRMREEGAKNRLGMTIGSQEKIAAERNALEKEIFEKGTASREQLAKLQRLHEDEQQIRSNNATYRNLLTQGDIQRGLQYPHFTPSPFGTGGTTQDPYWKGGATVQFGEEGTTIRRSPQLDEADQAAISAAREHTEPEEEPLPDKEVKKVAPRPITKNVKQVVTPEYQKAPTTEFQPITPPPTTTAEPVAQPDPFEVFKAFRPAPQPSIVQTLPQVGPTNFGSFGRTQAPEAPEELPSFDMLNQMKMIQQLLGSKNITY